MPHKKACWPIDILEPGLIICHVSSQNTCIPYFLTRMAQDFTNKHIQLYTIYLIPHNYKGKADNEP